MHAAEISTPRSRIATRADQIEAELIQSFIDRARKLEPQGLVVPEGPAEARDLYLEDGDILFLPAKSRLITIAGEVRFPTAVT